MRAGKFLSLVLAVALLGFAARAEPVIAAAPGASVDLATFHERLAPYGRWVRVSNFAEEVWIPADVPRGWRPYSDGQWVMTEYGWTFVSADAWGWAVWHYGNWMLTDDAGWVWAPGKIWAPAWVSWRVGNGYAAWAPLPPEHARLAIYPPASPAWICVREDRFTQPIAEVSLPIREGTPWVRSAQPLAKISRADGLGVNPGPRGEAIAAATGEPVRAVSARAVIGDGVRSIGSAPSAPRASPLVIQAMRAAWSREPASPAVKNGLHANQIDLHPNQSRTRPQRLGQAGAPPDAAEQKARAQAQVAGQEVQIKETERIKEQRPSHASDVQPPINEVRVADRPPEARPGERPDEQHLQPAAAQDSLKPVAQPLPSKMKPASPPSVKARPKTRKPRATRRVSDQAQPVF